MSGWTEADLYARLRLNGIKVHQSWGAPVLAASADADWGPATAYLMGLPPARILCDVVCADRPTPNGRHREVDGHRYTPRATRDARATLRRVIQVAYPDMTPTAGPIGIALLFYVRGRVHGDIDNLEKLVEDACNALVWHDDKQVIEVAWKRIHLDPTFPRTHFLAYRLEG